MMSISKREAENGDQIQKLLAKTRRQVPGGNAPDISPISPEEKISIIFAPACPFLRMSL